VKSQDDFERADSRGDEQGAVCVIDEPRADNVTEARRRLTVVVVSGETACRHSTRELRKAAELEDGLQAK
jgi:hypothetical protein